MINKILCLLFAPKYVVMRGVQIENRALMFLGVNPAFSHDPNFGWVVTFSNKGRSYYADSIYKIIWSRKSLMKWRKLLGKRGSAVLARELFVWNKI